MPVNYFDQFEKLWMMWPLTPAAAQEQLKQQDMILLRDVRMRDLLPGVVYELVDLYENDGFRHYNIIGRRYTMATDGSGELIDKNPSGYSERVFFLDGFTVKVVSDPEGKYGKIAQKQESTPEKVDHTDNLRGALAQCINELERRLPRKYAEDEKFRFLLDAKEILENSAPDPWKAYSLRARRLPDLIPRYTEDRVLSPSPTSGPHGMMFVPPVGSSFERGGTFIQDLPNT